MSIQPYYERDGITIYHGRAEYILPSLDADVMVTDPPYGIAYRSNSARVELARGIEGDDDTSLRDAVLDQWASRPALVFGTWRSPRPAGTRALLVWDTKGALGMGALDIPWKPAHQEIYVLGRGFSGRRESDVLTFAPVQSLGYNGRTHPHEKPIELMRYLIARCPDGTLIDPFMGSGTTLRAAKDLGRRAIGIEIDERYCEIAARRLEQQVLPIGDIA